MAIINVSFDTDITALIASDAVSEGDAILLAKGIYNQSVIISKNYVRILSKECGVVFDGNGVIAGAFTLNGVTGVEIHGVLIRNYLAYGINVSQGSANRILCNSISDITGNPGRGINVTNSSGNLIWNNQIRNVSDGVELIDGSTHNWVLENRSENCSDDCFESYGLSDRDNAFIGNTAVKCSGNAFEVFGINNLAYCNVAIDANADGLLFISWDSVAIGNSAINCDGGFFLGVLNVFAASNKSIGNSWTGIGGYVDFGIFLKNLAAFNQNSGFVFGLTSDGNLIYYNRAQCNTPENIVDLGTGNNLLCNIDG